MLVGLITFAIFFSYEIFRMLVKIRLDGCWWALHWALQTICWTGLQHCNTCGVDVVTLDSAHGHSKGVIDALKSLKKILKICRLLPEM